MPKKFPKKLATGWHAIRETLQGCDGGYAFLAAKWASDVGLVPKSCSEDDPLVRDPKTTQKRWKKNQFVDFLF